MHSRSPLDEANKLLLQFSLSPRLLQIINRTQVEHNVACLAKVNLSKEQTEKLAHAAHAKLEKRTSWSRLRILISISSIILPVFVICDVWSCSG